MNIVILEDNKMLASNISKRIRRGGYNTFIFNNCHDFKKSSICAISLYIIDIGLPDGTGLDIIKYLRLDEKSNVPILIMSCLCSVRDKVLGLDYGADDYIIKPFSPDEFMSRIKALFRRPINIDNNIKFKHKRIDFNSLTKEVFLNGKIIHIPNKEKLILELFILNKGEIITKNRLINFVWCDDSISVSDNTINATISKLRKKMGNSFILETHINEGYILRNI